MPRLDYNSKNDLTELVYAKINA